MFIILIRICISFNQTLFKLYGVTDLFYICISRIAQYDPRWSSGFFGCKWLFQNVGFVERQRNIWQPCHFALYGYIFMFYVQLSQILCYFIYIVLINSVRRNSCQWFNVNSVLKIYFPQFSSRNAIFGIQWFGEGHDSPELQIMSNRIQRRHWQFQSTCIPCVSNQNQWSPSVIGDCQRSIESQFNRTTNSIQCINTIKIWHMLCFIYLLYILGSTSLYICWI